MRYIVKKDLFKEEFSNNIIKNYESIRKHSLLNITSNAYIISPNVNTTKDVSQVISYSNLNRIIFGQVGNDIFETENDIKDILICIK